MFKLIGLALGATVFVLGGSAAAAEKPEVGPAESWVHAPPKLPAPLLSAKGAALGSLIQDGQLRFGADGFDIYQNTALKVQTAQGLQALSTISFAWSPATDRLVLHRLRILRGDQTIDVLPKDGVFTVARREEKLDSEGRLDGILSAIVKLNGLQVGDVIDMAYTIHRHDPLFKDRVDWVSGIQDVLPVAFDRVRIIWPEGTGTRWRVSGGMPEPHVTHQDGLADAEITNVDVIPLIKPQGAPARFQRGREFSVSSYKEWADVSAAMAPLFETAVRLKPNSPVKAEAAAIAAKTEDPNLRAAAALALVEDKIRYLAQTLGEGGYKAAAADDTWDRRYGDCKAKTALLLALLNELGIKAEPVLVSTTLGEDLDTRLPSLAVFNHVFVRAVIDGRDYWLDGTRGGDLSLAALSIPNYGYVLPLQASGTSLVHLAHPPLEQPQTSTKVRLDASKGLSTPAAAHVETTLRGDQATGMRLTIANLTPTDLDRDLRDYWRQAYDFITPTTVKAEFNPKTGEETLTLDGEAKLDWSGGYEPDGAVIGFKFDSVRDPTATHPEAPFALSFPVYTENEETITLPNHGVGFRVLGDMVDRRLAGYALKREAGITDGVFHMRTSSQALVPEITYAQAKADADPITALSKTTLRVDAPVQTSLSEEDLKGLMDKQPSTADGYLDRGDTFMNARRYKEAIADYNHAAQLDPKFAKAVGHRALAHIWLQEPKAALADADLAEQLDPREPTIYRVRGVIAEDKADWPDAIANFTRSIDLQPETFGYFRRAQDYLVTKDFARALRDLDAQLKLEPDNVWPHVQKAIAYIGMKDSEKAHVEIDAVRSAAVNDDALRARRLSILVQLSDRRTARVEADAAIAAHPTAANYLQRISTREIDDLAGKEADAAQAHAVEPKNVSAIRSLTFYRMRAKDFAAAAVWADKAVALSPSDLNAQIDRARVRVKLGQIDQARAGFAAVRRQSQQNATMLNNLCYEQATIDFDLLQALEDCDASLALKKFAAALDSRGFVLMRLGRDREARATFDAALALNPTLAASLFGRSLIEQRLGDAAAAAKDKQAALLESPSITTTFASYGVAN